MSEFKYLEHDEALIDVDQRAWETLLERRGGCRCLFSPPCNACTEPLTEEELNSVGFTQVRDPQSEKLTYRDVLRAIADGALPSEYQGRYNGTDWLDVDVINIGWMMHELMEFRTAPSRFRIVNGFTVPAPITTEPSDGRIVYWANPGAPEWMFQSEFSARSVVHRRYLGRGLLFSTAEAAIANAKAMCNVDPNV